MLRKTSALDAFLLIGFMRENLEVEAICAIGVVRLSSWYPVSKAYPIRVICDGYHTRFARGQLPYVSLRKQYSCRPEVCLFMTRLALSIPNHKIVQLFIIMP